MQVRLPKFYFAILILSLTLPTVAVADTHSPALQKAFGNIESDVHFVQDYGPGCGVDYPCPRPPFFARRYYGNGHFAGQVYIRNNYGVVNIYNYRRHRHIRPYFYNRAAYHRFYRAPYRYVSDWRRDCGDWCDYDAPRDFRYDDKSPAPVEERAPTGCGGYPCSDDCGVSCWFSRYKEGYCGHGCDVYREKVRFEAEERVIQVPKPVYYRDSLDPRAGERPCCNSDGYSSKYDGYTNRYDDRGYQESRYERRVERRAEAPAEQPAERPAEVPLAPVAPYHGPKYPIR